MKPHPVIVLSKLIMLFLMIAVVFNACIPCDDCEPTDDEPYVNLQFYTKSDLNPASVAIRRFNEKPGEEILYFQDTTSSFILPLSMWADSSMIILDYVYSPDYEQHLTDSIYISYEHDYVTSPKNIVEIITSNPKIISHSFDSLVLVCKDTVGICKSNESTIKAYF